LFGGLLPALEDRVQLKVTRLMVVDGSGFVWVAFGTAMQNIAVIRLFKTNDDIWRRGGDTWPFVYQPKAPQKISKGSEPT
jgi:hypothetical protein